MKVSYEISISVEKRLEWWHTNEGSYAMALDSIYRDQIREAFDAWEAGLPLRFRHKVLLGDLRQARDAYRQDVKGDEKSLAEFEREVQSVAREHGIYYEAETSFKKLNDYLKLGYQPKDLCEANVYMRFPDNCEALFTR